MFEKRKIQKKIRELERDEEIFTGLLEYTGRAVFKERIMRVQDEKRLLESELSNLR